VIQSKGWDDFLKFESWKRYILGPFSGLFYSLLYSEYSFPNSVMAAVFGYFSIDLIPWVMEILKKILEASLRKKDDD